MSAFPTLTPLLRRAGFFQHGGKHVVLPEQSSDEVQEYEGGLTRELHERFQYMLDAVAMFNILTPYDTAQTLDEGLVMVFASATGYGYIEAAKDGKLYAFATDHRTHATAWEIPEPCVLFHSLSRIKKFLEA